ncbi:MAG: serine hydrolase domain-containing protein [Cyclobacteriaceae bacterium]
MRLFYFINIIWLFFLVNCTSPGEQSDTKVTVASKWIEDLMDEQKIPGISIAVSKGDSIIWAAGFGHADLENNIAVTTKTKFRIGSISKTLTASALAQLYEQGKIDLDDEIQTIYPEFPRKRWPFTTRQLAGHLGGVRHYKGNEFLIRDRYNSVKEGLVLFENDSLLHQPGTKYRYSSHAWNLISAIMEESAKQDFLSLIDDMVFDKLNLKNTVPDFTDSLISDKTRFYERNEDGKIVNAPYVDNSYKWAGGGFLSNAIDVVKFALAHKKGGVLQDETLKEFITSQKTSDGKPTNYGMGFRLGKDENDRNWYGHTGGSVGGISVMRIYPEEDIVIVILSNSSDVSYGNLPDRIVDLFAD